MGCRVLFIAAVAVALAGCAGRAPVPGGSESTNIGYYKTQGDFMSRLEMLEPGMGESEVLGLLGRSRADMRELSRGEVLAALYGSNTVQVMNSAQARDETDAYLRTLYGYRLEFKSTSRDIGFVNPIRVRTDEQGFAYAVNLIFRNGVLMEKPDLAGGVVHNSRSNTLFDYLTLGTVVNRIP